MNNYFKDIILDVMKASDLVEIDKIQELWSGYGSILRFGLKGSDVSSIVVKHVCLEGEDSHPRGWNTDLSHQRKLKSYRVETAWYQRWSRSCDEACHVPECFVCESNDNEMLIVLEDLDRTGYEDRKTSVSIHEMKVCLKWLAFFHATFMGKSPDDLWEVGTYWHLDTRPDEFKVLEDKALKDAAGIIDQKLKDSHFQTFVHGDAKLANFCFSQDGKRVAAVDFQYVGGGCGMKDVAYFIGSCLHEVDCERYEAQLLDYYFQMLKEALEAKLKTIDVQALECDWRSLYAVAWTDFHRFMKGWSPGHWKINDYSERMARKVLENL